MSDTLTERAATLLLAHLGRRKSRRITSAKTRRRGQTAYRPVVEWTH